MDRESDPLGEREIDHCRDHVNITSRQDFNNRIDVGSKRQEELEEFIISSCTSPSDSKENVSRIPSGGGMGT